jgi:hypothetical protein
MLIVDFNNLIHVELTKSTSATTVVVVVVGWVDFGLFFTFSTKVPLRFVTYLPKVLKIATTKIFTQ